MKRPRPFLPSSPDAVLTKDEVARWMRVSPRTIQRLIHEAGMPTLHLTERQPRFLARQVLEWLTKRGEPEGGDGRA